MQLPVNKLHILHRISANAHPYTTYSKNRAKKMTQTWACSWIYYYNQCSLVEREFHSNATLPMLQNYHFNLKKNDTPCRLYALRHTQPPLYLTAFASQYLPCPFQTQQHDNHPFISLSSLSPSILPPSAILLAIQTWKLCWMTPRFRHTFVSRTTSSVLTFQKRRTHLCFEEVGWTFIVAYRWS